MLQKIQSIVNDDDLTCEEKDDKLKIISQTLYNGGELTWQAVGYADTTLTAMTTATVAGGMGLQHGTMYALTGLTGTM